MDRAERRKRTFHTINKRKEKLKNWVHRNLQKSIEETEDGYFENNSIMNGYCGAGNPIKTNTRKGHSSYRHKGGYGPANNYSAHDKRQIEKENDWEEEEI